MGLIFTKGDLKEVSEEVAKYKVCFLSSRLIAFPSLFFTVDLHTLDIWCDMTV